MTLTLVDSIHPVLGVIMAVNVGENRNTPLDPFSVVLSVLAFGGLEVNRQHRH